MRNFLLKHRFRIIFATVGALSGFIYWRFVGCASGTCPITSNWYTMGSYGIIMGWLVGDLIKIKSKTNEES